MEFFGGLQYKEVPERMLQKMGAKRNETFL